MNNIEKLRQLKERSKRTNTVKPISKEKVMVTFKSLSSETSETSSKTSFKTSSKTTINNLKCKNKEPHILKVIKQPKIAPTPEIKQLQINNKDVKNEKKSKNEKKNQREAYFSFKEKHNF
jgi:LAS superfamily LD-carboxypeptidase LdcB